MEDDKPVWTLPDSRELLDYALGTERGIKLTFPNWAMAWRLVCRLRALRSHERKRSKKIFGEHSPRYGTSPWDSLHFDIWGPLSGGWGRRISDGREKEPHTVVISKSSGLRGWNIEPLGEDDNA